MRSVPGVPRRIPLNSGLHNIQCRKMQGVAFYLVYILLFHAICYLIHDMHAAPHQINVMSGRTILISFHVMSLHIMALQVLACPCMSLHVLSCHVFPSHVLACHAMFLHVMPCSCMSCHVLACNVLTCLCMNFMSLPP